MKRLLLIRIWQIMFGRDYQEIIKGGEWYPSADHYIKHMYYNAFAFGMAEALSAMAPCPWIYKNGC